MNHENSTSTEVKEAFDRATFDRPVGDIVGRAHSRRRRRVRGAAGAATLATALFVVIVAPFGQPSSAFAGWTPEPQQASAAVLAQAEPNCTTMLNSLAESHPDVDGSATFDQLGWSDMRGNGLVLIYPSDSLVGICTFVDLGNGFGSDGEGLILTEEELNAETGDPLQVIGIGTLWVAESQLTLVIGHVHESVERVTVTADGWTAEASTYEFNWLAWWPDGHDDGLLAQGYGADGTLIDEWQAGDA